MKIGTTTFEQYKVCGIAFSFIYVLLYAVLQVNTGHTKQQTKRHTTFGHDIRYEKQHFC